MILRWILIPALMVTMIGCAPVGQHRNAGADGQQTELDQITVRVSGFGTYEEV